MSRSKRSRHVLFFLVVVGVACIIGYEQSHKGGVVGVGSSQVAPQWVMEDLDGKDRSWDEFSGKVVLVNFWATWSAPCRAEIPEYISLKKDYGLDGFEVVGVNLDDSMAMKVVAYVESVGINYPVLVGSAEVTNAFGGIAAIPKSFLINRQGEVVQVMDGLVGREELEPLIRELL